jgi:hypothetical protein
VGKGASGESTDETKGTDLRSQGRRGSNLTSDGSEVDDLACRMAHERKSGGSGNDEDGFGGRRNWTSGSVGGKRGRSDCGRGEGGGRKKVGPSRS